MVFKYHNFYQFLLSKQGKYLAYGCLIVFTLLLAVTFIHLFTIISQQSPQHTHRVNAAVQKSDVRDFNKIAQAHLFGEYLSPLEHQQLPKTLLNLKLIGIMQAVPERESQVILGLADGSEKIFKLGDTLPGGAKLIKIMQDSIVIERNRQKESLSLPQNRLNFNDFPETLEFEHD